MDEVYFGIVYARNQVTGLLERYDLTGITIMTFTITSKVDGSTELFTGNIAGGTITITDALQGEYSIIVTKVQTTSIPVEIAHYEVVLTTSLGGLDKLVVTGDIRIIDTSST